MWKQGESIFLAAIVCFAGCGRHPKPLMATYPVHGKVTHKNGGSVDGGMVQFQPEAEPSATTCAAIGKDGAYSLITMRDGVRAEGAVAGPNRVLVTTAGRARGLPVPVSTTYPTPYTHPNLN